MWDVGVSMMILIFVYYRGCREEINLYVAGSSVVSGEGELGKSSMEDLSVLIVACGFVLEVTELSFESGGRSWSQRDRRGTSMMVKTWGALV